MLQSMGCQELDTAERLKSNKVKLLEGMRTCTTSKEKVSFNFMAAVTVHSDFGTQENKVCHCFYFFPFICHEVVELDAIS